MRTQDTPRRYDVDPQTGCWLWNGPLNTNGYGMWERNAGERSAHREFYVLHVGPIPADRHIHHVCATRRCVNPDHLMLVTRDEHNVLEGAFAGREEVARALRASGLSYVRIAAELGCSRTTAYRLVNPASAEAGRRYKRERPEHYRELRRTYHKRRMAESPTRCVKCGAGMSVRHRSEGLCIACRREQARTRKEEIQRMWREGCSLAEIAVKLDSTVASIGQTVVAMRRDGWDLPHRYVVDEYGRRLPK